MKPNLDLSDRALDGLLGRPEAMLRPGEVRKMHCLVVGSYANAAEIELHAEASQEFDQLRLPMIFCDYDGTLHNADEWRPYFDHEPTMRECQDMRDKAMAEVESNFAARIALARELGPNLSRADFEAACKIYQVH